METRAMFASAAPRTGMYESFFLRAVAPDRPAGVWIRYTVHKPPGQAPVGALWCTRFDGDLARPAMHKLVSEPLSTPAGAWLGVGEATIGPGWARGRCGDTSWSLQFTGEEHELHHLSPEWLYRVPLPRTKLTAPAPGARFEGTLEVDGQPSIGLEGWRGTIGHNWGAEHAERWIWLHGTGFEGEEDSWLDLALGRLRVAGRMTPWVANGALALDRRRERLGGLWARRPTVSEGVEGCRVRVAGERGLAVEIEVSVPGGSAAGWRYSDPDGGAHDVVNCSVARIEVSVKLAGGAPRLLRAEHGGAYELGMRESDHGVPLAPFGDG